jgi:hypothetical protein
MTPNDIKLRRVTLSDCCPWPCPRIWLICKALTSVSHGRGHRFKPCTAPHRIKHLHVILQLYSSGFGTAGRTSPRRREPVMAAAQDDHSDSDASTGMDP